jgi:hypothetical protein
MAKRKHRSAPGPNVITTSKQDLAARCVRISGGHYNKSWQARWNRRSKNLANWNAYHSRMDWSHKLPWQTQQPITDFGISVEQTVGTLERGLTDTEDWLTVDPVGIGEPVLDADTVAALMKYHLMRIWQPGDVPETSYNFANLIGDGVKRGILESIATCKVYGRMETRYQYRLETSAPRRGDMGYQEALPAYTMTRTGFSGARVVRDPIERFRLCVDLVPWEDWYPDPSLLNKYVIHEVTVPLNQLAANPDYDPKVIDLIRGTAEATYSDMYKRVTQDIVYVHHQPDEVRVREYWGDLIDPDTGEVLATNCFWTVCNNQLLRPPTPNPFWHGRRPFVSAALLRTPNSVTHKALADDAVLTWQFLCEMLSLMFDGALGSVWGKHQMRSDYVENVDDFQEGIPQAATFLLRPNTPEGYKALEHIDSGELPSYAMEIFNLAMREFQTAIATNDLRLGQQPPKEATATSVVEAMQASGSLFESIAARFEDTFTDPTFELVWMTILQYMPDGDYISPEVVQILGPERALMMAKMSPQERFVLLSQSAKFKCRGLRGVAARSRTLTKMANIMQLMGNNPMIQQAFQQRWSWQRFVEQLFRNSGLDMSTMEKTQQEKQQEAAQQMVQEAMNEAQVTQPGNGDSAQNAPPAAAANQGPPPPNGGSPPALQDAGQDQLGSTGPDAMAPKTPAGMIPGAPQPQGGGI